MQKGAKRFWGIALFSAVLAFAGCAEREPHPYKLQLQRPKERPAEKATPYEQAQQPTPTPAPRRVARATPRPTPAAPVETIGSIEFSNEENERLKEKALAERAALRAANPSPEPETWSSRDNDTQGFIEQEGESPLERAQRAREEARLRKEAEDFLAEHWPNAEETARGIIFELDKMASGDAAVLADRPGEGPFRVSLNAYPQNPVNVLFVGYLTVRPHRGDNVLHPALAGEALKDVWAAFPEARIFLFDERYNFHGTLSPFPHDPFNVLSPQSEYYLNHLREPESPFEIHPLNDKYKGWEMRAQY